MKQYSDLSMDQLQAIAELLDDKYPAPHLKIPIVGNDEIAQLNWEIGRRSVVEDILEALKAKRS